MPTVDELDAVERSAAKVTEWTTRLDADVEAAYKAGHSLSQIAARMGRTLEAVRQRLIARGVELRPRGRAQT